MRDSPADLRALLRAARDALAACAGWPGNTGSSTAMEADILLAHVLDVDRAWLFANPGHEVEADQAEAFRELVRRRAAGEPIAYLVGGREFWSLPLHLTPDVLIPRPETELLVQVALAQIPTDAAWRVADLGTGSGAVALAIAVERPQCEVHATELSRAALAVAEGNVSSIAPERVILHQGSWLEPLQGQFEVIVSNPPYVAADDPHLQRGDCRFEPHAALTPGADALTAIRRIARAALPYLKVGGLLAFEHGFEQGDACRQLLEGLGYIDVRTERDLEGRERVTVGLKT